MGALLGAAARILAHGLIAPGVQNFAVLLGAIAGGFVGRSVGERRAVGLQLQAARRRSRSSPRLHRRPLLAPVARPAAPAPCLHPAPVPVAPAPVPVAPFRSGPCGGARTRHPHRSPAAARGAGSLPPVQPAPVRRSHPAQLRWRWPPRPAESVATRPVAPSGPAPRPEPTPRAPCPKPRRQRSHARRTGDGPRCSRAAALGLDRSRVSRRRAERRDVVAQRVRALLRDLTRASRRRCRRRARPPRAPARASRCRSRRRAGRRRAGAPARRARRARGRARRARRSSRSA